MYRIYNIGKLLVKLIVPEHAEGVHGYPDGTFRPQENITHAEMIMLVIVTMSLLIDNLAPTGYADDATIPAWARGAAALSGKYGLLGGIVDNKFAPNASSSRAQAAAAIVRAWDILDES